MVITDAMPMHTAYVPSSAQVSQGSLGGPDPLVANVGVLQPGQSAALRFVVVVNDGTAGQTILNTAQAASADQRVPVMAGPVGPQAGDSAGSGGGGGDTGGGGTVEPGTQQLSVIKSATDVNGGRLNTGDVIEYQITVVNLNDNVEQTSVLVDDFIPSYTTYVAGSATATQGTITGPDPLVVNVGRLAPRENVIFTFRVTVGQQAAGRQVTNVGSARSDQQPLRVYSLPVSMLAEQGAMPGPYRVYGPMLYR